MTTMTLREIADLVGGRLAGDGARSVERVSSAGVAGPDAITFISDAAKVALFLDSEAACAIVPEGVECPGRDVIQHSKPYAAIALVIERLHPDAVPEPGISDRADVHQDARIGRDVSVGPFASVGARTVLEDGVVLGAGSSVGPDCVIGAGTTIHAQAVLYARVQTGKQCNIHASAVIGAPGFGYTREGAGHARIPQVGGVIIGDHVDVGPSSCIDAGTLEPTRIGSHTKIDNLVQVGHNCDIGERTLLCGQVGIAGSTTIGADCVLAGQVGVADHVTLGPRSMAGSQAAVLSSFPAGSMLGGAPAFDFKQWRRASKTFRSLPELRKEVRALRARIAELEKGTPAT